MNRERLEQELSANADVNINWIAETVALVSDANSKSNSFIVAINDESLDFYDRDFNLVNHFDSLLDYIMSNADRLVLVRDIDLCINMGDDKDESLMTYTDLAEACKEQNVLFAYCGTGEGGWPTFDFAGNKKDVATLLEAFGLSQEDIEEWLKEDEE